MNLEKHTTEIIFLLGIYMEQVLREVMRSNISVLLTKKPRYFQETKNTDIAKIVEQEQMDFLRLVGEQAVDKVAFIGDLAIIRDIESKDEIKISLESLGPRLGR